MDEQTRKTVLANANKLSFSRSKPRRNPVSRGNATWPMPSLGLSCHASQVDEFNADAKLHGFTGVEFKPDGTCMLSSKGQRRDYTRHRGMCDKDAGYGDAAPTTY